MTRNVVQRSALATTGGRNKVPELATTDLASHCITCSDEGLAMEVIAVDDKRGMVLCADADGARQTVEAALVVPPLRAGDRVLVHAGVALLRLEGAPA